MNYIGKITETLGIKIGESFDVKYADGKIIKNCSIDEQGIHTKELCLGSVYRDILIGKCEIIRKPFRPRIGEEYWFISSEDEVISDIYEEHLFDIMARCIGNCFRTEAEAEAHKDEIMAKFRGVMGDDRA